MASLLAAGPGATPAEGQTLVNGRPPTHDERLAAEALLRLWARRRISTPENREEPQSGKLPSSGGQSGDSGKDKTTGPSRFPSGSGPAEPAEPASQGHQTKERTPLPTARPSAKTNCPAAAGPARNRSGGVRKQPRASHVDGARLAAAAVAAAGPAGPAVTSSSAPGPSSATGPPAASGSAAAGPSGKKPTKNEAEWTTALGWMSTGPRRATACTCCAQRQANIDEGRPPERGDVFLPCTDRPGKLGTTRSKKPLPGQVMPCARCKALHDICVDPVREKEEKARAAAEAWVAAAKAAVKEEEEETVKGEDGQSAG